MKKLLVLLAAFALVAPAFAQSPLPEHAFASGSWSLTSDRLIQSNEKAPLAKVNIKVPQSGVMVYQFNVRYEGGGEDGHAGFGLHVFADSSLPKASWGVGKSYLLWLNYDEKPLSSSIPKGFSAQVYKSTSNSKMELLQSIDLNAYAAMVPASALGMNIPVKIVVDGNTGMVKIYDPMKANYYYYFYLGNTSPLKGSWISLRTNSLKASFGL